MSLSFKNKKQNVYVSAYTFRYNQHKHGTLNTSSVSMPILISLFPSFALRYFFPLPHGSSPFDSYTTTGSMLHSIT